MGASTATYLQSRDHPEVIGAITRPSSGNHEFIKGAIGGASTATHSVELSGEAEKIE